MGGMRCGRLLVAVALLAGLLVVVTTSPSSTGEPALAADRELTIRLLADQVSTTGATTNLRLGADVIWENRSGRTMAITSPTGALDSGDIPDGGSYRASLLVPGRYEWSSDVGGGELVVIADFTGNGADRALDHIPLVVPPPIDPADVALNPTLALELPRSTIIVGFSDTASVAEARAAIGTRSNWEMVGGLPNVGLVFLRRTSPATSFFDIEFKLDDLNNDLAVEFASFVFPREDTAVPPPVPTPVPLERTETPDGRLSVVGPDEWQWEPATVAPVGQGANWGHELIRAPAILDLLDGGTVDGAIGRTGTVVLDSGFAAHDDLSRLQQHQACVTVTTGENCTRLGVADHGNQVAGVIGADVDDVGINGIDPFSALYGVTWKGAVGPTQLPNDERFKNTEVALALLLDDLVSGQLENIAVINLSVGQSPPKAEDWWDRHADETCGPGPDDDATGTETCFPSNHDPTIEEYSRYGQVTRRVVEAYVRQLADPPLFVAATGNFSQSFCRDRTVDGCFGVEFPDTEPQGNLGSGFNWASDNWRGVGSNPIIGVESIGFSVRGKDSETFPERPSLARSGYSNTGGDISAPGWTVSTCGAETPTNGYCFGRGTSLATPVVAAVAGAMASIDPTRTTEEIRNRLLAFAVADTDGGAPPRVDAYLSVMSMPGAALYMVDVSDPTADGNRRVVYAPDGVVERIDTELSLSSGLFSQPDGVVDLRDFRRFRDAWLQRCLIDPEPGCPPPSDIRLDGGDDHPKRDLNNDGEVVAGLPASEQDVPSELTFPRYDFNGDGEISRSAQSLVPLRADGSPATNSGDAGPLTDLQVMEMLWGTAPVDATPDIVGVDGEDLEDLLVSGDVTFDASSLIAGGATGFSVNAVRRGETTPARSVFYDLTAGGSTAVMTLPVGTYTFETSTPELGCDVTIGPLRIDPGQDLTLDPAASVSIDVPRRLDFDAEATAAISARSCSGTTAGSEVEVNVAPLPVLGSLSLGGEATQTIVLDTDGTGTVDITSGVLRGEYELTATATLPQPPGFVERRATARVSVGEFYEREFAAITGSTVDPSGYAAVDEFFDPGRPLGPSVNIVGDVGFGALAAGDDRYRVYIAEPGDDPVVPAEADTPGADLIPVDAQVTGDPQINDVDDTAFVFEVAQSNGDITTSVVRSALTSELLATATASFGTTAEPLQRVVGPTINGDGRTIFTATDQADSTTLAENVGGTVERGPESPAARARLADDGTTVAQLVTGRDCDDFPGVCGPADSQIIDPLIVVGDGIQAGARTVIAEGRFDGWEQLSFPDITAGGDVIAFVGDNAGTRSVWVSLRSSDGAWTAPVAIADQSVLGEIDLDRPGVIQLPGGADGLADDRILVTVRSTIDATNRISVVPATISTTGNPASPFAVVGDRPQPVAEVGDTIAGEVLTRVQLGDSIARAAIPEFDDDHWVAFYAETQSGRQGYVRARALPPATDAPSGVVASGPGATVTLQGAAPSVTGHASHAAVRSSPRRTAAISPVSLFTARLAPSTPTIPAQASAPEPPEVFDGPHVSAVTVADDAPVARVPVTITNRSRTLDGVPAAAVIDGSSVLPGPVLLGPGESIDVSFPDQGRALLQVASPVVVGDRANLLDVEVLVFQGSNRPPTVDIDGPFVVAPGQDIIVRAETSDPDGEFPSATWDLDGDGVFGDRTRTVLVLGADDVETLICGGTCVLDQPYPITVEVTDRGGATATASSTVMVSEFDSEFALTLEPDLIQVNRGSSGRTYAVVAGSDRLPESTSLSFENVPADWNVSASSSFDRTTQINVSVPDTAAESSFDIDVVSTIGSVERRATLTVVTVFSLIPECTTTISGVVRDEAGLPVEGATVSIVGISAGVAISGADGSFTIPGGNGSLPILSQGFTTQRFTWTARGPEGEPIYVSDTGGPEFARCDETTTISPQLVVLPADAGLTGRAVLGIPNPVDPRRPIPTDQPLADAEFTASYQPEFFTIETEGRSGADGVVTLEQLPSTTTSGGPLSVAVTTTLADFWGIRRTVEFTAADAGTTVDAGDFPFIPRCTGTVSGGRVIDQFGQAVPGASVNIRFDDVTVTTDTDGRFTFDREWPLAPFNEPALVSVEASSTFDGTGSDRGTFPARLGECGATSLPITIELERPVPGPQAVEAAVSGIVVDADTGAGIPLARVEIRLDGGLRSAPRTRADGSFGPISLTIGVEPDPSAQLNVSSVPAGYLFGEIDTTITRDGVDLRLELVPIDTVPLSGTVTDIETGEPVENGRITASFGSIQRLFTLADGTYSFDAIPLAADNGPIDGEMFVDFRHVGAPPYWATGRPATLQPGTPNVVDLEVLRVCDGTDVRGTVLNAATLEPLEDVDIRVGSFRTSTDASGRYELLGLPVGQDNSPRDLVLFAFKDGFFSSSVGITSFCNGELTIDFGTPDVGVGEVTGTVTDGDGNPIAGVTLVGGWGASTTSGDDGAYSLANAPLGAEGADREWVVTAVNGLDDAQRSVTVSSIGPARADFVFGGNAPPEVSLDVDDAISEGDTVTFDASGTTDDGDGELTFAWSLLDDSGAVVATGDGPTWAYTFADDFVGSVRVEVTDGDGATGVAEAAVTATNVDPTVELDEPVSSVRSSELADEDRADTGDLAVRAVAVGDSVRLSGRFTDPGTGDTHVVTVVWGDGSQVDVSPMARSFDARRTYAGAGTFDVVVTVCDDDGGCGQATRQVTVEAAGDDPPDTTVPAPDVTTPPPGTDVPGGDRVDQPPPTTLPSDPLGVGLPVTGSTGIGSLLRIAAIALLVGLALAAIVGRRRPPPTDSRTPTPSS